MGTIELLNATNRNTVIAGSLGTDGVKSGRELVKYNKKSLGEPIAKNPASREGGKIVEETTPDSLKEAEKGYPPAFFMYQLFRNLQHANIDSKFIGTPSIRLENF